jgi:hypothetical protein
MLAKEIIHSIVRCELAPALKQAGFKKSGLTFTRRLGSTGQFIQIQLSSWNQGPVGSFYVNVGVMFDQMCPVEAVTDAHPKYDDCQFMTRLEQLLPDAPVQWPVDSDTPVPEVSKRLAACVKEIVQTLDGVASLADFESTGWVGAIPWSFPARFAYALGRDDEAESLIANEAAYFADRGVTRESLVQDYGFTRLQR